MKNLWDNEPVAIVLTVQALLAMLMGFGVPITKEQAALVLTFVGAVLGLILRKKVTPA